MKVFPLALDEQDRHLLEGISASLEKSMSDTLRELIRIGHSLTEDDYEEKKYQKKYEALKIEKNEATKKEVLGIIEALRKELNLMRANIQLVRSEEMSDETREALYFIGDNHLNRLSALCDSWGVR